MLDGSSSTDTPLDGEDETRQLKETKKGEEKDALKGSDHGFMFPPPVIELRGREVILAIGLFLAFSVCLGLVIVMVTRNAKNAHNKNKPCPVLVPADDRKSIAAKPEVCMTQACIRQSAYIINSRDVSVNPCENFWKYSCGKWIENNPIPPDRKYWSVNAEVEKQTSHRLKTLIELPVTSTNRDSAERKIQILYQKCVATSTIDKNGLQDVIKTINTLGGWAIKDGWSAESWDFQKAFTKLQFEYFTNALFTFGVGLDDKHSTRNILQFDQAGLGMPNKAYYLHNASDAVVTSYKRYMRKVALAFGASTKKADDFVNETFEFEKSIAKITISENAPERMDPRLMYNKITLRELQKMAPMKTLQWVQFLQHRFHDIDASLEVVLSDLTFFQNLSKLVTSTPKRVLNYYFVWCFLTNYATDLPKPIRESAEEYTMKESGTSKVVDRSQYCIEKVTEHLGLALGAKYVNKYFSHGSKAAVIEMITNIRNSLRDRFDKVRWMDKATRQKAIEKLEAMKYEIGFPDFITNTSLLDKHFKSFPVDENEPYFATLVASNLFRIENMVNRLRSGQHETQWDVPPHEVNAFYSPNENLMAFPAGILQSPYFDKEMPWYVNYGSIGSTIGHELTHGFDSFGAQYDKTGTLHDWWSPSSRENFTKNTGCVADYYSRYQIQGHKLDGKFTLEENIADIGGLTNTFHAYRKWEAEHGPELPLPGVNLTNHQVFFLRFALNWCSAQRSEVVREMLMSSPHSPAQFRVMGTLSQIAEFAEAYNCKPNTIMNPPRRCSVW